MQQTWRWFGPTDRVTLSDARQAGAVAIVTALHEIPIGETWTVEAIKKRQDAVRAAGMEWTVVESLVVSERIKLREPGYEKEIGHYIESLRNLASCGIHIVAYNLMPLFSWMRTELNFPLASGATTMRFDATAFAAFDVCMLKRRGAEGDWGEDRSRAAYALFSEMSVPQRDKLMSTILQGLPGGNGAFTLDEVRSLLDRYRGINADDFRSNAAAFLQEVCPVAEQLGMRLCVHPDDPPRNLLGLPRIVSTADDLARLLSLWPGNSNGITFCAGSLGVRADNDLIAMVRRFAHRIWFAHLRSTQREADTESFFEAAHLEGDADLIEIVIELLQEERRRQAAGDRLALPFRADHGQELLTDKEREAHPGYPAVGRLRGLAELRGVARACERICPGPKPERFGLSG